MLFHILVASCQAHRHHEFIIYECWPLIIEYLSHRIVLYRQSYKYNFIKHHIAYSPFSLAITISYGIVHSFMFSPMRRCQRNANIFYSYNIFIAIANLYHSSHKCVINLLVLVGYVLLLERSHKYSIQNAINVALLQWDIIDRLILATILQDLCHIEEFFIIAHVLCQENLLCVFIVKFIMGLTLHNPSKIPFYSQSTQNFILEKEKETRRLNEHCI